MIKSCVDLKDLLKAYLYGDISCAVLGSELNKAYYEILKGDFIYTERLKIYPLLKKIYTFGFEANELNDVYPCSEADVREVYDVLTGKKNTDHIIFVQFNSHNPYQNYASKNKQITLYDLLNQKIKWTSSHFDDESPNETVNVGGLYLKEYDLKKKISRMYSRYEEFLNGQREFAVHITYIDGIPDIEILLI